MNIHTLPKSNDNDDKEPEMGDGEGVSDGMGGVARAPSIRTTFPPRNTKEVWIYHERQESLLCGQHCLNNLLQCSAFSAVTLSQIAQQLDEEERTLYMDARNTQEQRGKYLSEASGNVDESGNFSLEVLKRALLHYHQVDLVSWSAADSKNSNPMEEDGFVVNRSSHWFTIRRIAGKWWNLNSTLGRPEPISDFFLSAFLAQLRGDNWLVFIPKGRIPRGGSMPDEYYDRVAWYTESELMQPISSATPAARAPFAGVGNKLGGSNYVDMAGEDDEANLQMIAEEDPELALAIAMSRQEAVNQSQAPTKEELRQKRLEAMSKRGL